jgi:hypothetical protein
MIFDFVLLYLRLALLSKTLKVYTLAICCFVAFVNAELDKTANGGGVPACEFYVSSCSTVFTLDEWAGFYLVDWAERGLGAQRGNDLIAALLHFLPATKSTWGELARCVSGLRNTNPPSHHQPLSGKMVFAILMVLLSWGTAQGDEVTAIVWSQWECCSRLSEIMNLKIEDIIFRDSTGTDAVQICFTFGPSNRGEATKTSSDLGSNALKWLLQRLWAEKSTRKRKPSSRFFRISQRTFNDLFSRAQSTIFSARFTSHCVRHGRASQAVLDGWSAVDVTNLGRWKSNRSSQRYRKPHLLPTSELTASSEVLEQGAKFMGNPDGFLHRAFQKRLDNLF